MKQVFFYLTVNSELTWVDPLYLQNLPSGAPIVGLQNLQPIYLPIGTSRKFSIANVLNQFNDLRVEPDKYVYEINLVECNIEADTTGWTNTPDRVLLQDPATTYSYAVEPTYNWANSLAAPDGSSPPRQTINTILQQATKRTSPETLYCRIKELANGEPFNWSTTNSGNYTIDKSHQLLVRHGDINIPELTLEFGHLVFSGRDAQQYDTLSKLNPTVQEARGKTPGVEPGLPQMTGDVMQTPQPVYLDYNQEYFNVTTTASSGTSSPTTYDDNIYPPFYKSGYYVNQNLVQPGNRPPFLYNINASPGTGGPYLLQGSPFKSNQQAKQIFFRFMVSVHPLF